MSRHPVPFSQRAVLLAPLVILVPAGALLASGGRNPVVAFAVCALVSYAFTLGVVCLLFLPALWIVSWVTRIRTWVPHVLGGFLGSLVFIGWDYLNWCSSGVDSGPPAESYRQWIAKSWFTLDALAVTSFGALTAAAYHFLATRKPRKTAQPPEGRG
jgi:hypothetical protein